MLETELGKGSKFSFTLDVAFEDGAYKAEFEGTAARKLESSPVVFTAKTHKILLVDDNPVNMLLARTIVRSLIPEASVYEAKNGFEAIESYKAHNPDIIFMDIQMPEMSGYEATSEIRKIEQDAGYRVPIVALTAGTVKGEQQRCIEAGMDDYLSKPILVSDISEMLFKYLNEDRKAEKSEYESKFDEYKHTDPEFFLELIYVSRTNISALQKSLKSYLKEENLKKIKQTGHALKGIALNLELNNLIELSTEIERLKEIPSLKEQKIFEEVDDEIQEIIDKLDEEIKSAKN